MDLLFPLLSRTAKISPGNSSNTAGSRSIFSGVARTLQRSGDRFTWDITLASVSDKDALKAALRNLRAGMRGQANRLWFADPSYKLRGSFPTGELLANGNFAYGAAAWSATNATFSVADGYARVQNSGAAFGYIANTNAVAIVNGASYVLRALDFPGKQTGVSIGAFINGGPTAGNSSYFASGGLASQGLFQFSFTASGTAFFVQLQDGTNTAGDFLHFLYASLSRCALVSGASQTGSALSILGLPNSTNGLLLPGDRVQIGTQLNTVAAPLNSDSSGHGLLQCQLPWRVSPANSAPVIIFNPMARCMLSSNANTWDESPGGMADFTFQIEESLDA